MFLKEKRNVAIKALVCADRCPERLYTDKEATNSPTVSIETMMLSFTIDA